MSEFKLIKWNSAVNAIIFLILGLLLLLYPKESLNIGGYLIASILMLAGVSFILRMIRNKGIETNGEAMNLVLSIGSIALSITIFTDPTWIIRMINVFVGIILILSSLMNLLELLKYKSNRTTTWWIYTVISLLILIVGIIVIINPLFLASVIIRVEGATLIINTLHTLLIARKVKSRLLITENSQTN